MLACASASALPRVQMMMGRFESSMGRILLRDAGQRTGMNFAEEWFDFVANDLFAPNNFLFTLFQIVVGDGLEVVNVIEINVLHEIDFGIDVARHGDVNE
jgi:hypothetical protein